MKPGALLGLLGHPVDHSYSPELFAEKFKALGRADLAYRTFDLPDISEFTSLVQAHPNLIGLNVTTPHKQSIMPFLAELSEEARAVGAVNTLVRDGNNWVGHNTDVWGFQRSIQPFLAKHHERALVIGTGGSAAAVHHVLSRIGIECVGVSRNGNHLNSTTFCGRPTLGYHELNPALLSHHLLIVHCTPVGMHPDVHGMVELPIQHLTTQHLVVDLIYNPGETALLKSAKRQGAMTLNGADMLRLQADRAWEIWSQHHA